MISTTTRMFMAVKNIPNGIASQRGNDDITKKLLVMKKIINRNMKVRRYITTFKTMTKNENIIIKKLPMMPNA